MRDDYRAWLVAQGYAKTTCSDNLSELRRIESAYGSIETLIASGGFEGLVQALTYSTEDEQMERPNPSRLPIRGRLRTNLASYKSALMRYRRFLET